ncbi:MAG: hypothetical protein ABFR75_08820 [Acidobacteriota bacterium]
MFFKLLLSFFIAFQSGTILVDKIAAVVNDEIITVSDIDKSIQFNSPLRKKNESVSDFYLNELKNLINYKVIYIEYRDQFKLTEEDFEGVNRSTIEKYGSLTKFISILKKFDMDMNDFREFVKEKILFDKVIREKFQLNIIIDFKEIEKFYNKEYLTFQKELNLVPKTIIEMTPVIEKHLREKRITKKLTFWLDEIRSSYKIINILKRGGKG